MALFIRVFVLILVTSLGLGTAGVAASAWYKATDSSVIRAGMAGDFKALALVSCGLALVFVALSVWQAIMVWKLLVKRPQADQPDAAS